MGLEDDILEDIEGKEEKPKSTIKVVVSDKEGDYSFKHNRSLTAEDIQRQRQDRLKREDRKRNLGNVPADKLKRHAVIKALMDTNQAGNETPSEIQKALEKKGVNISLVTVCKDLREMAKVSSFSMKKIDNMLIGTLKTYLNKLDVIAENSDSDETRIRAINAAFDDVRKLYEILDTIAKRTILEETEKAKLGKIGQPINEIIQFIDSPERVNKDIYYKDERDKVVEWLNEAVGSMIEQESKIYSTFQNPTAYNTFKKTTDDVLEIIRQIKNVPHRKKSIQQEGKHKE